MSYMKISQPITLIGCENSCTKHCYSLHKLRHIFLLFSCIIII